jgi:hypothetical protein
MDKTGLAFWLTLIVTLCWLVCFWWMYRISAKQNALLAQLHAQGKRIEKLSKLEPDLIKVADNLHPPEFTDELFKKRMEYAIRVN